jgi:N-acetylmuramoyl-L-alanine amidase
MKVAVFAGHVGKDSGAIDPVDKAEGDRLYSIEAAVTAVIASKIRMLLVLMGDECTLAVGSWEDRIQATKDCVIGVDVHCDACGDPRASGPHVMYREGSTEGNRLAYLLSDGIRRIMPLHRCEWGRSDLRILNSTAFPVSVVECGYLTCPTDEAVLLSDAHQYRLAFAIVSGLLRWAGTSA